jgi:hypothetical protein
MPSDWASRRRPRATSRAPPRHEARVQAFEGTELMRQQHQPTLRQLQPGRQVLSSKAASSSGHALKSGSSHSSRRDRVSSAWPTAQRNAACTSACERSADSGPARWRIRSWHLHRLAASHPPARPAPRDARRAQAGAGADRRACAHRPAAASAAHRGRPTWNDSPLMNTWRSSYSMRVRRSRRTPCASDAPSWASNHTRGLGSDRRLAQRTLQRPGLGQPAGTAWRAKSDQGRRHLARRPAVAGCRGSRYRRPVSSRHRPGAAAGRRPGRRPPASGNPPSRSCTRPRPRRHGPTAAAGRACRPAPAPSRSSGSKVGAGSSAAGRR